MWITFSFLGVVKALIVSFIGGFIVGVLFTTKILEFLGSLI